MPTPDKSRAVAHYTAMATEAELRAKLAAFTGSDSKPQPGCGRATMRWGDAECVVEYEFEPSEGDGWELPRYEASITIVNVLVNGTWCDAQDEDESVVPALTLACWTERLWEMRAEEMQADREPA